MMLNRNISSLIVFIATNVDEVIEGVDLGVTQGEQKVFDLQNLLLLCLKRRIRNENQIIKKISSKQFCQSTKILPNT